MAKDESSKQDNKTKESNTHSKTTKYVALGAVGTLIAGFLFSAGVVAQRHHNRMLGFGPGGFMGGHMGMMDRDDRPNMAHGMGYNQTNQNWTSLSGKVKSVSGTSFNIDQNGTTKTIKTDSNTRVMGAGINGLKAGDMVNVAGTANADGSIRALRVGVSSN